MKKLAPMFLLVCLLLSGCSWMDGYYVSVTPHRETPAAGAPRTVSASNYTELCAALEQMVRSATESTVIQIPKYDPEQVAADMGSAARHTRLETPLGAYAVEDIQYEIGDGAGKPAISVNITYLRSRIEIQNVRTVGNMDAAASAITDALDRCDPSIVLLVDRYSDRDLIQLVEDYAAENPQTVMELPQVTSAVYPEGGRSRVVELTFSYENSRERLRMMQNQVSPVFAGAPLYISTDGSDFQKYAQMYAYLMERFDYEIATSITPAYSLLHHGVGDHKAFATVFAALCRKAGLECLVVTGTRDGEPRTWNIICQNGSYLHVDLLRCLQSDGFRPQSDGEMTGYVWDYSAYPVCQHPKPQPEVPPESRPEAPTETQPESEQNTQPEITAE